MSLFSRGLAARDRGAAAMLIAIVVGAGVLAGVVMLAIDSGRVFGGTQSVQLATRSAVQALAQNCLTLDSQTPNPFHAGTLTNGQPFFTPSGDGQYCGSATDLVVPGSSGTTALGATTLVNASIIENKGTLLGVCIWYRDVTDTSTTVTQSSFTSDCASRTSATAPFSNVAYSATDTSLNPLAADGTPLCQATLATGGVNSTWATSAGYTNQPMVRIIAQTSSGPSITSNTGSTQTFCSQALWQPQVDGNAQPVTQPVMYPWIFPACSYRSDNTTVYITDHDNSDSSWGNRIRNCGSKSIKWDDGSTFSSGKMLDELVGQWGFPRAASGSQAVCGEGDWKRTEHDGVTSGFLDNSNESDCENSSYSGTHLAFNDATVQALLTQLLGQTRTVALGGTLAESQESSDNGADGCEGNYCGNYSDVATVVKFANLTVPGIVLTERSGGDNGTMYHDYYFVKSGQIYVEKCSGNSTKWNKNNCTYYLASTTSGSYGAAQGSALGWQDGSGAFSGYNFPQPCYFDIYHQSDVHHRMKRLCIVGTWGATYQPTTAQALAKMLVVFQ